MARVVLHGWLAEEKERESILVIKALLDFYFRYQGVKNPLHAAMEAWDECANQGKTVVLEDVPLERGHQLVSELQRWSFRTTLYE